jgi:hypothetical protein
MDSSRVTDAFSSKRVTLSCKFKDEAVSRKSLTINLIDDKKNFCKEQFGRLMIQRSSDLPYQSAGKLKLDTLTTFVLRPHIIRADDSLRKFHPKQ